MNPMIVLKWITNIVSILILGLVIFIIAAHILNPHDSVGVVLSHEEIAMSIAMGCLFIGAGLAFWKRILGGVLSTLAFTAVAIIQGEIDLDLIFTTFLALGISNLVLGFYNRKQRTDNEKNIA